MQVTVENSGGLQRRLTVQVPGSELQQQIETRLREIGKTARLKGFRKGRIPMTVLKQRFGPSVRNEVMSKSVETHLMEAIRQESLQLASRPVVEDMSEPKGGEDFEFTASVEVYPEIESIDVSGLAVTNPQTTVGDAEVDAMIETLREQRSAWEAVSRAAKTGDQVLIEYAATTESGRVPEEGMSRLAVLKGASGFDALEDAVEGLEAGQETDVELTFPDDFNVPELAGQKAQVSIKVDSVREKQVPEVDEEFIQSFGVASGELEELRREVQGNLEREMKSARLTFLKSQVVRSLLETHDDLEVPEGMVREEAAQLLTQAARQTGDEPDPTQLDAYTDVARARVKSGLLMSEIARQNDILVDGARVREAIETVASTYEEPREVVQMYYNNQELLRSVEGSVLEEQVVDWVLENAKVSEQAMAFNDLISRAAASRQGL